MKLGVVILGAAMILTFAPQDAEARDRYAERPPVMVSPDLSAPWVMQLQGSQAIQRTPQARLRVRQVPRTETRGRATPVATYQQPTLREVRQKYGQRNPAGLQTAAVVAPSKREMRRQIDPMYLPQDVAYETKEKPGTIVIDTRQNFLYHVQEGGMARRYGVGTGKPGFEWAGTHHVTQKREWPDWRPPAVMIARERKKGRILPVHMAGGPKNPLGARALYLGSTLYRIHGTNEPWTIGGAVSSGCIRMRNEDVVELYERVGVGTKVIVM
jgi:lipoprotein-anchoring transpeptidase ErfK/SrfK